MGVGRLGVGNWALGVAARAARCPRRVSSRHPTMTSRLLLFLSSLAVPLSVAFAQSPAARAAPDCQRRVRAGKSTPPRRSTRSASSSPSRWSALGRMPAQAAPPFFHIQPDVAGTFRWSGTTILIFTPVEARCRCDALTRSRSTHQPRRERAPAGRSLHVYVHDADREAARDSLVPARRPIRRAPIVALRFNQRVSPDDVARAPAERFQPHTFDAARAAARGRTPACARPIRPRSRRSRPRSRRRRPPQARDRRFTFRLARDWDSKRFPPKPDLVVLEVDDVDRRPRAGCTSRPMAPCRRPPGRAVPRTCRPTRFRWSPRSSSTHVPARTECDPDAYNPIRVSPSRSRRTRSRTRSRRPTSPRPARERPQAKAAAPTRRVAGSRTRMPILTVEDARVHRAAAGQQMGARAPGRRSPAVGRPDARLHVDRPSSRTGTSARSPASATATACGRPAAAPSCRSTPATSGTSRSGRPRSTRRT